MNNIAVYTCVTADYEHQGGTHLFEKGVDYLYFTDGKSTPEQSRWKVYNLPDLSHIHPRRAAKLPKAYPYFFDVLNLYKYTIWIDGDMEIIHPHFVSEILPYLNDGILLSPHFDNRDCAYGESEIRPEKYASEPMDQQIEFYAQEGFPKHYGLFEGGIIVRDMTNPRVKELSMMWYLHNMIFSYQDQVSMPYCLWKLNLNPDILPKSFRDFEWVRINAHKRED